jgi:hypothetical protein
MTLRQLLPVALASAAAAALTGGPAAATTSDCFSGWNPPNTLMLAAGSPQQGQIGKPFQTNLQVQLANTDGCPLTGSWAGVSVVFTAPSSGPSGTFATTGTNVADVGTDANGTAIAPMFTANRTAGDYEVIASSSYGSVTLYLTNTATGVAASIAPVGQVSQSATVDSRYGRRLRAQVRDADGQPVVGAGVSFALGTGATGAAATFPVGGSEATALTDADGIATSPAIVANDSPGRFSAGASTDGVASSIDFSLRNLAPRVSAVGRSQSASVDHRYRRPLQLRVLDTRGRPVEGVTVTFTLPQAVSGPGAAFLDGSTQATATTNSQGRATSPPLEANTTAGRFRATATVGGATPVSYMLRNVAGPPATITVGAASGESTPTGSTSPIRLAVTVADKDGNAVAGAVVTFVAPARGPSGSFRQGRRTGRIVRVRTNIKGIAVAPPLVANGQAGGYAVTAHAGAKQTAFALVNTGR